MKTMKKTLAILLILVMCLSMLPTWALAEAPAEASETDAALMSEEPAADVMQEPIPEEIPVFPPEEPLENAPEEAVLQEEIPEAEEPAYDEPEPGNETVLELDAVSEEGSGEDGPTGNDASPVEDPAEILPNTVIQEKVGEAPAESIESPSESDAVTDSANVNPDASEAVTVIFRIAPENAVLAVYAKANPENPEEKTEIEPEEDGSYLLLPGEYSYTLTAEGYVTIEGETLLVVPSEEPLVIEVTILPVDTEAAMTESLTSQEENSEAAVLMAESGTCGDEVSYTLDNSGTLTISGVGKMENYRWSSYISGGKEVTYVTSPFDKSKTIKRIVVENGVTSIGNLAFRMCENLTTVILPNSLQSIGEEAFEHCEALNYIVIPESVTTISKNAFLGCDSLKTAGPIGGGYNYEYGWTEEIPTNAFETCSSLGNITVPEYITLVGSTCPRIKTAGPIGGGFDYEFGWKNRIPSGAFSGCSEMRSITLPGTISSIGSRAFSRCSEMRSIMLPGTITSIESGAFSGCTGLINISIPEGVVTLEDYTFSGCSRLTNVDFPEGLQSIKQSVFNGCTGLMIVTIPSKVKTIGEYCFYGCIRLEAVTIPEGISEIGSHAFTRCSSLESIKIPASVSSMGEYVFDDCTGLTTAGPLGGGYNCEYGWSMLPDNAFMGSEISSVTISDKVTRIGKTAFYMCSKLKTIYFLGAPPIMEQYGFNQSFQSVRATAYYPTNGLWSEQNLKNYGGTLTWTPYSPNLRDFNLDQTDLSLACGDSVKLSIDKEGTIFWKSTDSSIAAVNRSGYVIAKKAGNVEIIAYAPDGNYQTSCKVHVLFNDVATKTDYYYDPVYWAVDQGITTGRTATTFDPYGQCTRGHIVTFLWRAFGEQEPTINNPFTDVNSGDGFYKAVLWAYENGITTGQTATTFGPWKSCTRGQIVTFLWRAIGQTEPGISNPFTDVNPGDGFYRAVLWAVENGVTTGRTPTTFDPWATCTRGQAVTFLYRAMH